MLSTVMGGSSQVFVSNHSTVLDNSCANHCISSVELFACNVGLGPYRTILYQRRCCQGCIVLIVALIVDFWQSLNISLRVGTIEAQDGTVVGSPSFQHRCYLLKVDSLLTYSPLFNEHLGLFL